MEISMLIKHVVLLPFNSSLSKTEIEKVMVSIAELKNQIPQVISFSWGENNSPENLHRGYLHGFIMEFKNDHDRKIYLEHPKHTKLVEKILLPALSDLPIVFDYSA
jgi:hypothetical protein